MLNPNSVKPVERKPPPILPDEDDLPYDDAGVSLKPPLLLPGQDDLPCDDGVPMETPRHLLQIHLLLEPLGPWLAQRQDGYAGGNMFLYYSPAQVFNQDFRGPDVFVVLDVPKDVPEKERKSWVVWEEGKGPDVVIELLSKTTASEDKNAKKLTYQNQVQVPEYFWYDPHNPEDWAGFALKNGIYQPLRPNAQNHFISKRLNLALVRWRGVYRTKNATWLRWATLDGELLMTEAEQEIQRADLAERKEKQAENKAKQAERKEKQAENKAEQERQRAEQEKQRAEHLAAQLRAMGVDPDKLG